MLDFTTNQWFIVVLIFVLGWLLGLMSRSGGAKWRRKYEAERDAHVVTRREYDDHVTRYPATTVTTRNDHLERGSF